MAGDSPGSKATLVTRLSLLFLLSSLTLPCAYLELQAVP